MNLELTDKTTDSDEIFHPESNSRNIKPFNLDSLPVDVRRAGLPQIKDYFSPERIKEARKIIRQALFETELLSVIKSASQSSLCLLNLPHEWIIDSDKRIVLHSPKNRREYSTLPETFPKIFISKTAAKFAAQSPQDAVNLLIAGEVKRMLSESGAVRSLSASELDEFNIRLSFHLTVACRGFFQKNGAVLLWKLARSVHSEIPASVLRFALLLRGPQADALDATIIWQNLEEIAKIFDRFPAVLPVFVGAVRHQTVQSSGSDKLGAAGGFMRAHWLRLDSSAAVSGGILKTVKESWFGRSLRPEAWEWLCARKYVWGQSLFSKCKEASLQAAWLNLMAKLAVQPKLTVYRALLPVFAEMRGDLQFDPAQISSDGALLESFIEYANGKHRSELSECVGELKSILAWWLAAKPGNFKKQNWEWFKSQTTPDIVAETGRKAALRSDN